MLSFELRAQIKTNYLKLPNTNYECVPMLPMSPNGDPVKKKLSHFISICVFSRPKPSGPKHFLLHFPSCIILAHLIPIYLIPYTYTPMPTRCPWCLKEPIYIEYHDKEWGKP